MRQSPCIKIAASLDARVNFLQRDYGYMIENQEFLKQQLEFLKEIVGKETLNQWYELIDRNDWGELVKELLIKHYDKLYSRSQNQNYQGFMSAREFSTDDLSITGIDALAKQINQA
jgi:tRNA 2-selenouridine synthase